MSTYLNEKTIVAAIYVSYATLIKNILLEKFTYCSGFRYDSTSNLKYLRDFWINFIKDFKHYSKANHSTWNLNIYLISENFVKKIFSLLELQLSFLKLLFTQFFDIFL